MFAIHSEVLIKRTCRLNTFFRKKDIIMQFSLIQYLGAIRCCKGDLSMKRFSELDSLRGLSALAVILFHYSTLYEKVYDHTKSPYFVDVPLGYYGVNLFFIISGFVIYMTIINSKGILDFVVKRAIRLYPAYIIAVIFTATLVWQIGLEGKTQTLSQVIINFTMLQEFFGVKAVDGVYWTLKIELIFYFIMAVCLILRLTKRMEIISILWLVSAAAVKFASINMDSTILVGLRVFGIVDYCHFFIAGITFYKLWKGGAIKHHIIILLCIIYNIVWFNVTSTVLIFLFFGLFYLLIFSKTNFLNNKALIFLGTISYSLYLIHQNFGYMIIDYLEKQGMVNEFYLVIPITASILVASILTFYVERPIQNILKGKWKARQKVKKQAKEIALSEHTVR